MEDCCITGDVCHTSLKKYTEQGPRAGKQEALRDYERVSFGGLGVGLGFFTWSLWERVGGGWLDGGEGRRLEGEGGGGALGGKSIWKPWLNGKAKACFVL